MVDLLHTSFTSMWRSYSHVGEGVLGTFIGIGSVLLTVGKTLLLGLVLEECGQGTSQALASTTTVLVSLFWLQDIKSGSWIIILSPGFLLGLVGK